MSEQPLSSEGTGSQDPPSEDTSSQQTSSTKHEVDDAIATLSRELAIETAESLVTSGRVNRQGQAEATQVIEEVMRKRLPEHLTGIDAHLFRQAARELISEEITAQAAQVAEQTVRELLATTAADQEKPAPHIPRPRWPKRASLDSRHRGFIASPGDRIHKATVESLMPDAMQTNLSDAILRQYGILPGEDYWAAYCFESNPKLPGQPDTFKGLIGFRAQPEEAIWKLLQQNGPLAVKAQFALWARAYAETDATPGLWITLMIPEFCDDLGYRKQHKGGHRRENKLQAMNVARLLTSIELCGTYITPKGDARRIRGPVWARGAIGEQMDGYADLFGTAREGDPSLWDPVAFSYAPGPYFADSYWHAYNRNVALIGAGLLQLPANDPHKWAIMVGGYIATLARLGSYADRRIRAESLLQKTGLAKADTQNPRRQRETLEHALDKVQGAGVIGGWEWDGTDAAEPDMDDPQVLASLADADLDDWRRGVLIIHWPADLQKRAERLERKRAEKDTEAARQSMRQIRDAKSREGHE